jgi:hypothetical protein
MNTYEQMRNTLKYLIDVCEDFHQDLENEIDGHYDILPNYVGAAENFLRRLNEVKTALSLPLRNCDVGTGEEQYARFKKWCEHEFYKRPMNPLTGEPCKSCPCYSVSVNGIDGCNYLHWSQMPYEGEVEYD